MITRVRVKNYRNLADVDVKLGPLTVLVGRNGAGKSTFLDVLRFVRDALRLGLDSAIGKRGGIAMIRRWTPEDCPDVEAVVEIRAAGLQANYSFCLSSDRRGAYRIKRESCHIVEEATSSAIGYAIADGVWVETPDNWLSKAKEERGPFPQAHPTLLGLPALARFFHPDFDVLYYDLARTGFYSLSPNNFRQPQRPTNEADLQDYGENLYTALMHICDTREHRAELVAALVSAIDGVDDVQVREDGGYLFAELRHEMQGGLSAWFDLAMESDGTLQVLGTLVALCQETQRTLVAVEEPELHIHPGALAVLADVIKEASLRRQVLITTQSPDLISEFHAEDLRVVERTADGTRIGPVDDIQLQIINEQLFSGGDLLRIEGLHLNPEQAAA